MEDVGKELAGSTEKCDALALGKGDGMLAATSNETPGWPHTWKENGVVVHTARLEEKLDPGGQHVRHSPCQAPVLRQAYLDRTRM